jgi:hypothetical protein
MDPVDDLTTRGSPSSRTTMTDPIRVVIADDHPEFRDGLRGILTSTVGIDATRRIVHQSPHVGVLVVTMLEDDGSVFAAMRAGVRGYLLKGADKAEIVRAVQAIASGEAIFGPAIALRVIDYFATPRTLSPKTVRNRCRTSSPSSKSRTAPRRSCGPEMRASAKPETRQRATKTDVSRRIDAVPEAPRTRLPDQWPRTVRTKAYQE